MLRAYRPANKKHGGSRRKSYEADDCERAGVIDGGLRECGDGGC